MSDFIKHGCLVFQTVVSTLIMMPIRFLIYLGVPMILACCCKNASLDLSTKKAGMSEEEACLVETPTKAPPEAPAATNCPTDPIFGGIQMKTAALMFPGVSPKKTIEVELAITEKERARGLMYRTHLADGHGMLFIDNGPPRIQSFWMHNTCIPLDMLFIDEEGRIAGILENVPPMNDKHRSISCRTNHVLEVPAGWSRKNGVKAGQKVILPEL